MSYMMFNVHVRTVQYQPLYLYVYSLLYKRFHLNTFIKTFRYTQKIDNKKKSDNGLESKLNNLLA